MESGKLQLSRLESKGLIVIFTQLFDAILASQKINTQLAAEWYQGGGTLTKDSLETQISRNKREQKDLRQKAGLQDGDTDQTRTMKLQAVAPKLEDDGKKRKREATEDQEDEGFEVGEERKEKPKTILEAVARTSTLAEGSSSNPLIPEEEGLGTKTQFYMNPTEGEERFGDYDISRDISRSPLDLGERTWMIPAEGEERADEGGSTRGGAMAPLAADDPLMLESKSEMDAMIEAERAGERDIIYPHLGGGQLVDDDEMSRLIAEYIQDLDDEVEMTASAASVWPPRE